VKLFKEAMIINSFIVTGISLPDPTIVVRGQCRSTPEEDLIIETSWRTN
jgi:hypothetical protein